MKNDKELERFISKALAEAKKRKERTISRAVVQAGKELVLMCLWVNSIQGRKVQNDVPKFLAELLAAYPAELKKVLAFYDEAKGLDASKLIKGFEVSINGDSGKGVKLWLNFKWDKLPPFTDSEKHKNSYADAEAAAQAQTNNERTK